MDPAEVEAVVPDPAQGGAEASVDHQDIVGAAPVQQPPKNDFLVERKIAAVRRYD